MSACEECHKPAEDGFLLCWACALVLLDEMQVEGWTEDDEQ